MSACFGDCEQRELKNRILNLEAENERLRKALRSIEELDEKLSTARRISLFIEESNDEG